MGGPTERCPPLAPRRRADGSPPAPAHQNPAPLSSPARTLPRSPRAAGSPHPIASHICGWLPHLLRAAAALEGEGVGDHADGQDPHILGEPGDHRGGTGAGAATHAGGDEDHVAAGHGGGNLLVRLLGGLLAEVGLAAGACGRTERGGRQGRGERQTARQEALPLETWAPSMQQLDCWPACSYAGCCGTQPQEAEQGTAG